MRKKVSVAKRRAASLKGWRTRQRMKAAREQMDNGAEIAEGVRKALERYEVSEFVEGVRGILNARVQPSYIRRALPNPFLEIAERK